MSNNTFNNENADNSNFDNEDDKYYEENRSMNVSHNHEDIETCK